MKIQNINDVESFFKIVDQCKGPVEFCEYGCTFKTKVL